MVGGVRVDLATERGPWCVEGVATGVPGLTITPSIGMAAFEFAGLAVRQALEAAA